MSAISIDPKALPEEFSVELLYTVVLSILKIKLSQRIQRA